MDKNTILICDAGDMSVGIPHAQIEIKANFDMLEGLYPKDKTKLRYELSKFFKDWFDLIGRVDVYLTPKELQDDNDSWEESVKGAKYEK